MRKKLEKFCNGLLVVVVLLVVALMINHYFWVNAQKKKVTTTQTAQVVTQPENGWGEVPMAPDPNAVIIQEVVTNDVAVPGTVSTEKTNNTLVLDFQDFKLGSKK